MRCVRVNIQKVDVERFSIKDGADLKIFFDDGSKKCLAYSSKLDDVGEDAKNIITKIQVYEKAQNRVLDAEDALDSFVSVVIEGEEDMIERIKLALTRLKDDKQRLKGYGSHTGYIDTLNKMQKKSFEFKSSSSNR